MAQTHLLGPWIRRVLVAHLVRERHLARNTQASYRETVVFLVPFVRQESNHPSAQRVIDQLSPPVVQRFLEHWEPQRGGSVATRNQRLSALHALARCLAVQSPEHMAWCSARRAMPGKKIATPHRAYGDKPERDAWLAAPHRHPAHGRRAHAGRLFLYHTGARARAAAQVTVAARELPTAPAVRLLGKGHRIRYCPAGDRPGLDAAVGASHGPGSGVSPSLPTAEHARWPACAAPTDSRCGQQTWAFFTHPTPSSAYGAPHDCGAAAASWSC